MVGQAEPASDLLWLFHGLGRKVPLLRQANVRVDKPECLIGVMSLNRVDDQHMLVDGVRYPVGIACPKADKHQPVKLFDQAVFDRGQS